MLQVDYIHLLSTPVQTWTDLHISFTVRYKITAEKHKLARGIFYLVKV